MILVPSSSLAEMIGGVRTGGFLLPPVDFSAVPPSVSEDANQLAAELYGDYPGKYSDFTDELAATYLEARDKDFVMFFNSGGWGWNLVGASSGWQSIITGIQDELVSAGYKSLLLNYQRTKENLQGYFDEGMSIISLYPTKARDLAGRVEFLTKHIPNLRVIIMGESTGAIIADSAMAILKDNPQVYSIQTGPPFWHKNGDFNRTLVLRSSGLVPDSFSQGDFLTMIGTSLEELFGFSPPGGNPVKVLFTIGAPGHEYWWQHPEVHTEITDFLQQNFGLRQ